MASDKKKYLEKYLFCSLEIILEVIQLKDGKILILGLIGILVLVVAASGCTSQSTSNKTYSANGVSFTYPGAWSELNSTDLQKSLSASTVLGLVGNNTNEFYVAKVNVGSNQVVSSISQWASGYNSTIKSNGWTFVSGKSLTVDGVPAYQITAQTNSSYYGTDVFFVKNSAPYLAVYVSPSNDQQTLENILNSLKIT
jgi:hypothetical protein